MKKNLLLALGAAMLALTANATVRTVNNSTISAGQYTEIQGAVDASAAGDTVYVHGSPTSYGNVTLKIQIVLIGAGYHPTGTQYNLSTVMGVISLNQSNSTNIPTGSVIKGINFSTLSGSSGTLPVNNITIERCDLNSITICGNGWIIKNDILTQGIFINNSNNIIISNNMIGYIYSSNKASVIITNNMINGYINDVSYAIIANNFFIDPSYNNFSGTQNTYNKNIIIYADPTSYDTYPPIGNTGAGNLNTTERTFITTSAFTFSTALFNDWNLLSTSLGIKYGTDGTDIGIYGGSFPMPNLTGAGNMPQIVSMDIQNSVIPLNGTINVEIKAIKQK